MEINQVPNRPSKGIGGSSALLPMRSPRVRSPFPCAGRLWTCRFLRLSVLFAARRLWTFVLACASHSDPSSIMTRRASSTVQTGHKIFLRAKSTAVGLRAISIHGDNRRSMAYSIAFIGTESILWAVDERVRGLGSVSRPRNPFQKPDHSLFQLSSLMKTKPLTDLPSNRLPRLRLLMSIVEALHACTD